jgi:predicted ATP-grasp superfamily ATP-dependent carboligase
VVSTPDATVTPAAFAARVLDEARRIRADVVIPGSEPAMLALAANPSRNGGPLVAAPPAGVVERSLDKELIEPAATAAGLEVPATTVVVAADLEAGNGRLPLPAVAKPTRSELMTPEGRMRRFAVRVVDSRAELAAAVAGLPGGRALVQPYVPGDLYAVSGVVWNGRLTCSVHQAAQRIWPPRSGIIAHAVSVEPVAWLDAAVARFLREFRWSGIFQLQFIRRGDRFLLIDFNPRLYASLALAVGAGANLPAIWVEHLLGEPVGPVQYRTGVSYRSEEHDVRAVAFALRQRRFADFTRAVIPRRERVHAVMDRHDPLPARATFHKLWRRLRP